MKSTLLIAAVLAFGAGACQAHARLETSEPKPSSTLDGAPKQLHLRFSEALEPAFSKLVLRDAANREIALPKGVPDKPNEMTRPLPALSSGTYRVQWSTVARDGHRTKGEFSFRIK